MPRRHGKTRLLYKITVELNDPHLLVLLVSERSKELFKEVMCMTYREQSTNHQKSHIYLCDDADHAETRLPVIIDESIILTYSDPDWNPPSGFLLINFCESI